MRRDKQTRAERRRAAALKSASKRQKSGFDAAFTHGLLARGITTWMDAEALREILDRPENVERIKRMLRAKRPRREYYTVSKETVEAIYSDPLILPSYIKQDK
jgi:predicted amidohydrolase YtcJ